MIGRMPAQRQAVNNRTRQTFHLSYRRAAVPCCDDAVARFRIEAKVGLAALLRASGRAYA